MEVVAGAAEEFAEGSFPRTRRAEDEDGAKGFRVLGYDRIRAHKRESMQKGKIGQAIQI